MSRVFGIIYKAINKINGKMYIGQTTQPLNKRVTNHISRALIAYDNMYLHNAIRKYGKENFIWEIIAKCNSLEELNKAEVKMIEKYNTFKNGYNLTKGGEGSFGFEHSEKSKRKLSEINKGKNNPFYGKKHSEKIKKKISNAKKGEKSYLYGKYGNKHPTAKRYVIITPEGKKIFVHGIVAFCKNYKEKDLYYQDLIKVANGEHKQHKGYKCKRLYEELVICQN